MGLSVPERIRLLSASLAEPPRGPTWFSTAARVRRKARPAGQPALAAGPNGRLSNFARKALDSNHTGQRAPAVGCAIHHRTSARRDHRCRARHANGSWPGSRPGANRNAARSGDAAVGGGLVLANRPSSKPSASPATTTPTATTVAPTGARIDAPTAPATVACGGKLPARHAHPMAKSAPTTRLDPARTYTATFQTSCGSFSVRMDPSSAPIAAANFVSLARKGFYDSTWFHRILPGGNNIGVVQGGDPQGTGQGGPGYTIKDEPAKGKAYTKYTIAMAKASTPNSACF